MGYNSRIWCLQGDGMAIEVSDIEKLREYIRGVLGAAQHHANNVDGDCIGAGRRNHRPQG